jgi:DUF971 family protein
MQTPQIRQEADRNSYAGSDHEGMIAWDQRGLVVLWPDGHRSSLSWVALRAACQCAECHELRGRTPSTSGLSSGQ